MIENELRDFYQKYNGAEIIFYWNKKYNSILPIKRENYLYNQIPGRGTSYRYKKFKQLDYILIDTGILIDMSLIKKNEDQFVYNITELIFRYLNDVIDNFDNLLERLD